MVFDVWYMRIYVLAQRILSHMQIFVIVIISKFICLFSLTLNWMAGVAVQLAIFICLAVDSKCGYKIEALSMLIGFFRRQNRSSSLAYVFVVRCVYFSYQMFRFYLICA